MDAIILAGGRGERLMPLTSDRPKCLVEIAGRPLVCYQLRWLARQGIRRVVISCGYRWTRIQQVVGDGGAFGLQVEYAPEEKPLGRGGGLRKALAQLRSDPPPPSSEQHSATLRAPVLACNGDVLTSLALRPMLREHRQSQALATLLLVPYVSQHGLADVDASGRIVGFREKPSLPYSLSGGVYIMSPAIEELLPRRGDHERTAWPQLAANGQLHGYRFRGYWQSVDSVKDVALAERQVQRRRLAA